jgi:hypothetical protein
VPQVVRLNPLLLLTHPQLACTDLHPTYPDIADVLATMVLSQDLRAVPRGPWTRPLDFNLYYTHDGERRIPFGLFVKPELTSSSCTAFPHFCSLPAELQLRIIYFCDSSTLFQLMQTSSVTRTEAKKLFWSYPDVWYYIDGMWLYDGGYTGDTEHDTDFLACVEQLNINLEDLYPGDWIGDIEYDMRVDNLDMVLTQAPVALLQIMDKRISDFWQTLRYRCPRVTRVTLSITDKRRWSLKDSLSVLQRRIVNMCPSSISVFLSLLPGDGGGFKGWDIYMERSLWQLTEGDILKANQWELICPIWTQRNILPPPKEFRGAAGWFHRGWHKYNRFQGQKTATRVLLNEAIEKQHFQERHEPFSCFVAGCNTWFYAPGEWTKHATDSDHDGGVTPPDDFKALFDQHKSKLDRLRREVREARRSIFNAWNLINGNPGEELGEGPLRLFHPENDEDQIMIYHMESELQHYAREGALKAGVAHLEYEAELAFLHQIEHDPLYAQAKPARESRLWCSYQDRSVY